ncbi:EamA family transporter [Primorskyibacter sp. S187A]|uniref:EamA family transporter n=1 Tax=Primorskyibacter sp. S187A TaxID=3415130 RepID=UPI003C7D4A94
MSWWVIASLLAAFAQALRFMLQKSINLDGITATGATFARFVYSAPLMISLLALWVFSSGKALPDASWAFYLYAMGGGVTQIMGTICIVLLFSQRHFAVGTTFMKTEVILTVLVGFTLLGDAIPTLAFAAICLGVVGLVVLSLRPDQPFSLREIGNRSALLGLLSGLLFAFSAVSYRGASLELEAAPLLRAACTLAFVTGFQMCIMAVWLRLQAPGEITAVMRVWQRGVPLGLLSLAGSFGWFFAFTLQNAAYVKAVGQVELIFSLLIGALVFGERVTPRELLGMALLGASIAALLLAAA